MKLDKYQQAVADCRTNAVVSAGAGSGKTTVLAERFLRLVEEGRAGISEILTLTFTRKAAAEMYERIYGLLLGNIEKHAVAAAAAEFDKAAISTLDSFCSRITRDCSTLFGIPSSFKTDESAAQTLSSDVSLDFILSRSWDPYLGEFIFINGFENVWKNFFVNMAMNYLSLGDPKDFNAVFASQMETAAEQLALGTGKIKDLVDEIVIMESDLVGVKNVQEQLRKFSADSYDDLKETLTVLAVGKPRGRSDKPEFIRCKEIIDELRPAVEELGTLIDTVDNRDLLEGLFKLTSEFQEELFSRKRSAGILGFHDVLTMAVSGLRTDKELRRYYKGLFRFIMIDEFQDNNSLQKELLYLLAEAEGRESDGIPSAAELDPSKLFFVGDEKQSIYRFRGADVSVFKQLSSEFEASGGVSMPLNKNYRSEPGLIRFFNDVFSHVMRDSSLEYQAEFVPLKSREAKLSKEPDIRLLYKPWDPELPEDSLSAEESEAYAIADYIIDSVGKLEVNDRDTVRPADYNDFAMLFRSGTNQKTYEKVFRLKGIPYSVHSVRSLFQEAPVNDIYNLLQICLYPEDRTASAAFLRSPLVNISDLSFVQFILSRKPVFAEGQEECCIGESDRSKYRTAISLYERILSLIDREPLADIIKEIWFKSGYRYLILSDSSQYGYLEYYDYLHALAADFDGRGQSTASFLDYVRENLGEYRKIDELKILGYSSGGVKMMPVHQSKGLEFPVVIIANAGNRGVADRGGSAPAYISETDGLSFNLVNNSEQAAGERKRSNYFYSRGKAENADREDAELRRLLYVALTRAENHLVISGCHGKNNRSGEKSMLNMFLSAFGWIDGTDPFECPELEPYIKRIENIVWTPERVTVGGKADMTEVSRLYAAAEIREFFLEKTEYAVTELNAEALGADEASGKSAAGGTDLPALEDGVEKILLNGGLEAEFGTLAHRIIEYTIKNPDAGGRTDPLPVSDELRPFFRKIEDPDWPHLFSAAFSLAEGFFESEIWKTVPRAVSFESELPFSAVRMYAGKEILVNGIIDLVIETDEEVIVVDFKTDRRIIPGEYDLQMSIYIDAASELFSKPARCSLFYLRGGIAIEI